MQRRSAKLTLTTLAIVSAAIFALTGTASGASVINGNFEAGMTGWQTFAPSGSAGQWGSYSGTSSPISGQPVPAPPEGTTAAMSDASFVSSEVMYQDIGLEPGYKHTLAFTYYYENQGAFVNPDPDTLDYNVSNQQFRIEIMKPTAAPDSVAPSDILGTILRTDPSSAPIVAPTAMSFDLSPYAGQTVRLRFANAAANNYFPIGVDAVSVTSVDETKPVVSALAVSPKKFKAAKKGASIAKSAGASVSYTLSEAATVAFKVERASVGRKSGSKCVKAGKKNAKAKKCTRWTALKSSFTTTGTAGVNKFKFTGRLKGKQLKPGAYRLSAVPTDLAKLVGLPATAKFKIVAP
jgi:hypothetical protein